MVTLEGCDPYALCPMPYALSPKSQTLYPILNTLYHIPFTLCSVPYTLNLQLSLSLSRSLVTLEGCDALPQQLFVPQACLDAEALLKEVEVLKVLKALSPPTGVRCRGTPGGG